MGLLVIRIYRPLRLRDCVMARGLRFVSRQRSMKRSVVDDDDDRRRRLYGDEGGSFYDRQLDTTAAVAARRYRRRSYCICCGAGRRVVSPAALPPRLPPFRFVVESDGRNKFCRPARGACNTASKAAVVRSSPVPAAAAAAGSVAAAVGRTAVPRGKSERTSAVTRQRQTARPRLFAVMMENRWQGGHRQRLLRQGGSRCSRHSAGGDVMSVLTRPNRYGYTPS